MKAATPLLAALSSLFLVTSMACSSDDDGGSTPTETLTPTTTAIPTETPRIPPPLPTDTPAGPSTPSVNPPPPGVNPSATPSTLYVPLVPLLAGTPVVYPPVTVRDAARASWTPAPRRSQGQVLAPGGLEGALSYPSEGLPPSLIVCAESLDFGETYCTAERPTIIHALSQAPVPGYQMLLPAGRYLVYAEAPPFPLRAYYSLFVPCGLHVSCPSHDPVIVQVKSGQLLRGVDPGDWYNTGP